MVTEKQQLGAIASGLTDLNEMRLSKFEFALLVIKIMEVPHACTTPASSHAHTCSPLNALTLRILLQRNSAKTLTRIELNLRWALAVRRADTASL